MRCPNCGKSVKGRGIGYCPYCGQSMGNINQDLREVTRVQIEYQEAKEAEKGWAAIGGICAVVGLVLCILSPFTYFVTIFFGIPAILFALVALGISAYYSHKAKKIKEERELSRHRYLKKRYLGVLGWQ